MNEVKIIALPFGGGSMYSFDGFKQYLPSNFILKTVEFPGRGDRLSEGNVSDIGQIAKDALQQIIKDVREYEYIIYGHSMGALVGYELTKEIIKSNFRLPSCLFFTGRAGPSVKKMKKIHSYPKDLFWKEISEMGGLPAPILQNEDMLDFFEPILRSDLKAVEFYNYEPMSKPFKIPIHVIAGLDEVDITNEKLESWQQETIYPLNKQFFPGNHFFINEHASEIVQQIISTHMLYSDGSNKS